MPRRPLHIGIAQLGATSNKERNFEKISTLLENVRDAEIVVLPEYTMFYSDSMFSNVVAVRKVAEPLDGQFVSKLSALAREYSVHILCGVLELREGQVYNTIVVLDEHGNLTTCYRKCHLFDAYGYEESRTFSSGFSEPPIFKIRDTVCSIAICFELRFPELFRVAALKGAEVMFVPAAWFRGDLKEDILQVLARARAHENGMFLVVCNQYSSRFCGRSCVVDPWGVVMLDLGHQERYVEIEIDAEEVVKARQMIPVLKLRRPLLYTKLLLL